MKFLSLSRRKVSKGCVLDGKNIQKLLKDETQLQEFLNKYFDELDEDKSGKLTREEMQPALLRIGELLGLPPPGTATEMDEMVDKLFKTLMADYLNAEVNRPLFIAITTEFLQSTSNQLQAKPLVMQVYDASVLKQLASDPEHFEELVEDFFREFDKDGSNHLSRLELKHALITLGLVPEGGASSKRDLQISRIIMKYGGEDMVMDRGEFSQMLKDVLRQLSSELSQERIVVASAANKPVLTGDHIRTLLEDKDKFSELSRKLFKEWDLLGLDRLSRTQMRLGFRKYTSSWDFPLLSPEEAEELCEAVFDKCDIDQSGQVEPFEFQGVLRELLLGMAKKFDTDPVIAEDLDAAGEAKPSSEAEGSTIFSWFSSSFSKG